MHCRGSGAAGRLEADLWPHIYVKDLVLLMRCPGLNADDVGMANRAALPAPLLGVRRKEDRGGAASAPRPLGLGQPGENCQQDPRDVLEGV